MQTTALLLLRPYERKISTMIASKIASRTAIVFHRQQKRGLIDWMVKWPDKVRKERK
jgi:non-homologous end joining protein Ku